MADPEEPLGCCWAAARGTDGLSGTRCSAEANPLLSRYGDSHPVKWNGLSIRGSLPARGFSITGLSRIGEKQHLLTRVPVREQWVGAGAGAGPGNPDSTHFLAQEPLLASPSKPTEQGRGEGEEAGTHRGPPGSRDTNTTAD